MSDSQPPKIYEFADFRLIPAEGLLLQNDQPVPLSPKVFETLLYLIERRGHLVLKSDLLENVWTDAFVDENAVSKSVWSIRSALNEDSKNPQFIQTVPKRGYRFVAEVREVGSEGLANATSAPGPIIEMPPAVHRRRWILGLAVVGVIAAVVLLTTSGFRNWLQAAGADEVSIRRLTLVPLRNASGNPEVDYLVEGVTNALIADLAKTKQLDVIALPADMRDPGRDPNDIGKRLNLDGVLSGSVSVSGARVRISMELLQVKTGRTLWANNVEKDKDEIQSLQKEIARSIVTEIRGTLSPKDQERLTTSQRVDPQAYDHYYRGRYYANRQNKGDQDLAIAEFDQAVQIDPKFAKAHAELALAYTWKHFSFDRDDQGLGEKASIQVEKAMQLNKELAEVYLARGRLLWTPENKFQHDRAAQDYKKALELDDRLDEAWNQLAIVYTHVGALDDALKVSNRGVDINPTSNLLQLRIGQTLNSQARYDDAFAVLSKIPERVHPSVVGHQKAWALVNLGRRDEASALLDELLKSNPEDRGGTFASIKAVLATMSEDHTSAEEWIKQALEKGKGYGHFHHTAYTIGSAYALMNKPDKAIYYLEMAVETGFPCYPSYEKDPNLNSLRQNPRFIAFMERLERQSKELQDKVLSIQ